MSNTDENAEAGVAKFRQELQDLYDLAHESRGKAFKMSHENFDFMVLCFLEKQMEHTEAVFALIDLKLYRDAGLIVRSMLEGLVQLLWAGQDVVERPTRWREFTYVSDWRKLRKQQRADRVIGTHDRERVENLLKTVAFKFYTEKANKCLDCGRPLPPDPYVNNWMGISYAKCFRAVEAVGLLDFPYGDISAWHHWDPEGFGEAIAMDPSTSGVSYYFMRPSLRAGAQALTNGFQCLIQTLMIADERFGFGLSTKLDSLRGSYLKLGSSARGG